MTTITGWLASYLTPHTTALFFVLLAWVWGWLTLAPAFKGRDK